MAAVEACRTAALGGHAEQCSDCGLVRQAYNSCRNRHCPKCQGLARAQWLAERFSPEVSEPVRLHVAAKRYLCAVEPDYFGKLSPDSVRSLGLQGGPMSADEIETFRRHPQHAEAVRLRRYDEEATPRRHAAACLK